MNNDQALSKARALLARAPVFDGHNDLPWVIMHDTQARGDVRAYDLTRVHERGDTDIPRLREGGVGAQFWAAFQPTSAPHPARTTLEQIDLIRRIEAAYPDVFFPARGAADFARARRAGKIASYHRRRGRRRPGEFAGAVARLARGGRAHADPLPQRDARLGGFGDRRAAPRRLQRVRPRRDRRVQPARHDRRRRACLATRASAGCSTSARRRSCCRIPTPSRSAIIRATRPTTCCAA